MLPVAVNPTPPHQQPYQGVHSSAPQGALGITTDLPSTRINTTESGYINGYTINQLVDHAGELLPQSRVAGCLKIFKKDKTKTDIQYNTKTGKTRLTNLCRCGNAGVCLRCAIQKAEQDKRELLWACSDPRYKPLLVTFTGSHHIGDKLADWDTKFRKACEGVKNGRFWMDTAECYGIKHTVWKKEHTYGFNGWHPHLHMIVFAKPDITDTEVHQLELALSGRFLRLVRKQGLAALSGRAVKVSSKSHDISEYLAKYGRTPTRSAWDIEHEIAQTAFKFGRKQSKTPFELLADSLDGDTKAGRLFAEFGDYLDKSKQKLMQWSRGAKDDLLYGERPIPDPQPNSAADSWTHVIALPRRVFYALTQFKLLETLLNWIAQFKGDQTEAKRKLAYLLSNIRSVNATDLMWAEVDLFNGWIVESQTLRAGGAT